MKSDRSGVVFFLKSSIPNLIKKSKYLQIFTLKMTLSAYVMMYNTHAEKQNNQAHKKKMKTRTPSPAGFEPVPTTS